MRLLHSADWHLGRLFHARSLIEDQAHFLDQVRTLVRELRPDALLIAGDVYDRAVPGPDAVALLDAFLADVVLGLRVPVVMIAGNHDSAERLGFGARVLAEAGLHIAGRARHPIEAVRLQGRHDHAWVYPVPYAEPGEVRSRFGLEGPLTHTQAMQLQLDAIRVAHPAGVPAILLAHAFVSGGEESESERPLSVGGSGAIEARVFAGFDYVALGHLHRAQTLGEGRLRYAGSPLKYSLSEVDHAKSLTLVELDSLGVPRITPLPIRPLRDLHVLTGTLAEVCAPDAAIASDAYIVARLTDRSALLDPMSRLRARYPNALAIERLILQGEGSASGRLERRRETTPDALFASFFNEVTGAALDGPQQEVLHDVLLHLGQGARAVLADSPGPDGMTPSA